MARIHSFNVIPSLPERLEPVLDLAYDLAWTWHPDVRRLFRRMDPRLWREENGNPVALLSRLSQGRIDALARDTAFLEHVSRARDAIREDLGRRTWFEEEANAPDDLLIAYFSAEFGVSEALPIYSGGLGVLAGDTLKSASGVGLPFVGVGLVYTQGYFHQYLNEDGWQQEEPYDNDFALLPLRRARAAGGEPAEVELAIEGRPVRVRVWEVKVGRTRLFLLDTNSSENDPRDREITGQLYGGGTELRFKQEIVLGIGGIRALEVLGIQPSVFHMNEGHSAFLTLERIRRVVRDTDLSFLEARELCADSNVFTTHTPVPAGFDIFSEEQLDRFLPRIHDELGVSRSEFLSLGAHEGDEDLSRGFNMAYLALRCSGGINAVSELHAQVSRNMWRRLWPGYQSDEVPIEPITNGVHTRTWVAEEMGKLLDTYLGPQWATRTAERATWEGVEGIPDSELWRAHERGRERLVSVVRDRFRRQLERKGRPAGEVATADELFDPHALTIGFARRFATYKRATLIFRQPERLRRLLTDPERPIQLVFAGKAHPQDHPGKTLIKDIVHFARDPEVRRRIVFLEEYDMGVARRLVQGVDVWLNNPRRPKEASGTSGMKCVPNGGLNLSVLDGWWAEAYDGTNGWAIGAGEVYEDVERGDAIEADLLLDILEDQVVQDFYDRGLDRLPRRWIHRMKSSMRGLSAFFSTDRMVQDYARRLYLPAHARAAKGRRKEHAAVRSTAARVERLQHGWHAVHVGEVEIDAPQDLPIGESVAVRGHVHLGGIPPEDVIVEIFGGRLDGHRRIVDGDLSEMELTGPGADGWFAFEGAWTPAEAGHSGCTVRVRPRFDHEAPVRDFPLRAWEG
ncbi:MAG: alpha-glucan family phosphorylase [Myxococcota bacterium]